MSDAAHSTDRSGPPTHLTLVGPRTQALLGACITVLTAYTLGLDWLGHRFLALPTGLWIVGLVMLIAEHRQQARAAAASAPAEPAARPAGIDLAQLRLPSLNLARVRSALPTTGAVTGVLEMVGVNADSLGSARRTLSDLSGRLVPPANTLRIGVDLAESDARELIAAGQREETRGVAIEWCRARAGLVTDVEQDLVAGNYDALIRRERRGDINIFTPEQEGRPAAWHDWSSPLPLGYAGVFPPRIDPARVSLAGCDPGSEEHAALAARTAIACAMLARTPARCGPGGRSALARALAARAPIPALQDTDGPLAAAMRRIAHAVEDLAPARDSAPGFVKAAARACGAYLATFDTGASPEARTAAIAAAAEVLGSEPESALRLSAALFAAGEDERAHQTLLAACRTLASGERACDTDPLAFIMSEVDIGTPCRLTLGRIAAGLGLLWSTAPSEAVDYLREDLLDDLKHAGWLRDRPADVELLKSVINALEHSTSPRLRAAA